MISANAMKSIVDIVGVYVRFGMIDAGSNIQLATYAFAVKCGRPIELEKLSRCIGTAEQEGSLPIFGWIDVGGFIGVMAVCKGAAFTLLSVGICQSRGLGCDFPPVGSQLDDLVCRLYTINSNGNREELQEIDIDNRMQLYYVDINSISNLNNITYVRQQGDYTGQGALLGGNLGVISYNNELACAGRNVDFEEAEQSLGTKAVVASNSRRNVSLPMTCAREYGIFMRILDMQICVMFHNK